MKIKHKTIENINSLVSICLPSSPSQHLNSRVVLKRLGTRRGINNH